MSVFCPLQLLPQLRERVNADMSVARPRAREGPCDRCLSPRDDPDPHRQQGERPRDNKSAASHIGGSARFLLRQRDQVQASRQVWQGMGSSRSGDRRIAASSALVRSCRARPFSNTRRRRRERASLVRRRQRLPSATSPAPKSPPRISAPGSARGAGGHGLTRVRTRRRKGSDEAQRHPCH